MRNADLDWDRWPVPTYLAENYRELHRCDDAVIVHHSAFYRDLAPGSVERSVEIGTEPNLYPLFLASGAARHIDAVDAGAAGLAYLRQQLAGEPDPSWRPFGRGAARSTPPCLLVAAFMENMAGSELGDGSRWPGLPVVDAAAVSRLFEPLTRDLQVSRIGRPIPGLPAYGYTGMVLL